jgi:uncharacterized protein YodC (DUF2158 family)
MSSFVIGDVVRLRSGSPEMTINAIDAETGMIKVVWFSDSLLKQHQVPADVVISTIQDYVAYDELRAEEDESYASIYRDPEGDGYYDQDGVFHYLDLTGLEAGLAWLQINE